MSGEKQAAKPIPFCVQFYPTELDKIESWRKAQAGFPSRGAAIRHFVSLGLLASADVPAGKLPSSKDTAA
jgi:hypothetical protein